MEKKKIDCALFFALEEEFDIIKEYVRPIAKDGYFSFPFSDKNGVNRECITGYVSKPGSLEAYKFLKTFYQLFEPQYIFIIGISGQLSDDIRIGDVVVASSIDKYDYNSKQKNGEYLFSGVTINLSTLSNTFSQLTNLYAQDYIDWQNKNNTVFKKYFESETRSDLINKKFIRESEIVNMFYGKIATGEAVVDDNDFKERLKIKDRKLLCVDMESFGFASANEGIPNIIIIRAISDTADGRKKEIDNFENKANLIRKWSLGNAFSFFNMLILQKLDYLTNTNDQKTNFSFLHNITSIDTKLKREGEAYFEKYASLFQHLLLNKIEDLSKKKYF